MASRLGMLGLSDFGNAVEKSDIDTVVVAFTDIYGRLMGKRLDAGFFLDVVATHGTHACDYLLTVDMEMEPVRGYRLANWDKGYGDFHLVPDLPTLRRLSWTDKTALVLCDVRYDGDGRLVEEAPRSLLHRQRERLVHLGFEAMAGSEIEYYLFQDSYEEAAAKHYDNLSTAGGYIEDYHIFQGAREENFHGTVRRHLRESGVPVESSKGEWGPGQHELNVRYAEVLEMADRHCVYKECLKEVAHQMGLSVSFMAKFAAELAGSSCHIHLSLWKDRCNAFGTGAHGPMDASNEFRWFLGGWLAHIRETMVFYAPTVNSYKRYQAASWAPTGIAWSYDNRTAGFRVVGRGESLRIECRVAGADCNPYLVYAAALAAGIDGIENRIEPPPVFEGDAYGAASLPQVPASLGEAVELFAESEFVRESFGAAVVEHYAHFFRTEDKMYRRTVTDWERKRYFERI
jgi:glutamine synthetase